MDPDVSVPFPHPCDLSSWMNSLISGSTEGPRRLQVDQSFYLSQTQPRNQFLPGKTLLANLRTVLKGAKEPQESRVFLLNFPGFWSPAQFLYCPEQSFRKKEKNYGDKNPNDFFLCWDFQLPNSLLGQFMSRISRNSLWPWCWVSLGVQSKSRDSRGRNPREICAQNSQQDEQSTEFFSWTPPVASCSFPGFLSCFNEVPAA